MKKTFLLSLILLLISVMPAFAVFCQNCGKQLPEAANFCPVCGKASSGAFQTAQPAEPVPAPVTPVAPVPVSPPASVTDDNSSLADYDFINQMELLLTNTGYGTAMRQSRELRQQNESRMARIEADYRYFGTYRRKLHDLHMRKQQAIESYLEAWKGTEYGSDRVRSLAEKDRALFVLSAVNEMIDALLTGGGSLASIARVEDMEKRLTRTTANYVITAPYLLVDNQRLNRGEPIWVIDVVSAEAKILHMGRGRGAQPICGWVSIYDLEKRSSWRSDPAFFYSNPTAVPATTVIVEKQPEPPVKLVIFTGKRYPYRHDRGRHDRGRRDDDRHDRDRHDRDRDKDHDQGDHRDQKRRHDFVVISPRFW